MKTAIQRLPDAEERALIEVACANGLKREELRCHMTRQQGSGRGRHPEKGGFSILSGQGFNISYDLMLCEFCGNLKPFEVCPAKVLKIKQKLLGEENSDDNKVANDELKLLRAVAFAVLLAYNCEDLWVDGQYGAAQLSEAHRLSEEWKSKYDSNKVNA